MRSYCVCDRGREVTVNDSFADSMSVWNLLREFRIRKVHMAVVLNEYGGTVGVCMLCKYMFRHALCSSDAWMQCPTDCNSGRRG